ncbi:MAG: DUF58 domain-containing protein [Gemmatimonadota bacterium]
MSVFDLLWRPRAAEQTDERLANIREVRRLELKSRRLMDSPALGQYASIFRGQGVEFSEVRAYQPGDPFQAIDWKVTARMRRPYVKRFVEERELTVLLAVDLSASNDFGTRGGLKRDLATEVASVLALAAMRSGDRVGLLIFTDRIERFIRPRRGRNRNLRLLYDLVSCVPEGRGTDMSLALAAASRLLNVRSLVFVVSDFVGVEALARPLLSLGARHDVVAVDVRDPAELAIPASGWVEVEDPETGERAVVDLSDPYVRASFEGQVAAEEAALETLFASCRVDHLPIRTDRPYEPELASFFAARGRRRKT